MNFSMTRQEKGAL